MTSAIKRLGLRLAPQLVALAVILLLNVLAFPNFFDIGVQNGRLYGSIIDVLNRGAPVALVAVGMTLVIATKGIDLSVGAVIAISGAVAAAAITSGLSLPLTLLVVLCVGLACGLWNGTLVALLDIQPIIATLVLMVAGRGIAQLITEGTIMTFTDPGLIFFGSGSIAYVPVPIVVWVLFSLAVSTLVRGSALGLLVESVGVNRRASSLAGIATPVLLMVVYGLCALSATIAGVIVAADIRGADANNAGLWLELDAILAVVVGGNSLLGGRFSIAGAILGALIIQSINTGILLSGFPPEFNLVIKAAIIVIILLVQSPALQSVVGLWLGRSARSGE